jgi:iron complex transport system ATP-binding protein
MPHNTVDETPVLALHGIHYVRNANPILHGIDWTIARDQHWALLGANGAGKTSLLKIVTGYEWPTAGTVHVLGQHFGECDLRTLRKTIGWVNADLERRLPERDTALAIAASGFDASIGLFREITDAEWQLAHQALGQLGVDHFADRPFDRLSQGEQQRVLIARALVNDPALVILDEPCAGLDPVARAAFLDALQRLSRRDDAPTMVLVTHHIEEIGPWIDRVLVLKDGRALAAGPTSDVVTDDVLSNAFGKPCGVTHDGNGYVLRLE